MIRVTNKTGNSSVRFDSKLKAARLYGMYTPFDKITPSFLQVVAWFELKGLDLTRIN